MASLTEDINMIIEHMIIEGQIPFIGPTPNSIEGENSCLCYWTGFSERRNSYIINNQDVLIQDLMFRDENPIEELDFRWVKIILICSQWKKGTCVHFRKSFVQKHTPVYPHWKTTGYEFTWKKIDEVKYNDNIGFSDYFIDENGYIWTEDRYYNERLIKINCKYNLEV